MKDIQIWAEGFRNGDASGTAVLLATINATNFTDACALQVKRSPTFARHFDQRHHTFWGCKIFATEEKARKKFG